MKTETDYFLKCRTCGNTETFNGEMAMSGMVKKFPSVSELVSKAQLCGVCGDATSPEYRDGFYAGYFRGPHGSLSNTKYNQGYADGSKFRRLESDNAL